MSRTKVWNKGVFCDSKGKPSDETMSMSEAETLSVGAKRVLAAEFPGSDVTRGFPVVRGGSREVYAR